MSEEKLQRDVTRAKKARDLLDNEMMREAFRELEQRYIKAWTETHPAEANAREHYYLAIQILGDVQNHLKKVAASGSLSKKALDELAGR